MGTGKPLQGDRSAYDCLNFSPRHANDIDAATGIHHTLGGGANQAAAGNHTHAQLHNAVTVTDTATVDLTLNVQALSAAVIPGGIKLDTLGAPDDNTNLNASTAKHGLLPKLSNVATQFLNGVGSWVSQFFAFRQLTDAPTSYIGQAGKFVRVKATQDGVEFADPSGHTIQDEGVSLPRRSKLDFVGDNVVVTDDLVNDKTKVTVRGPRVNIVNADPPAADLHAGDMWVLRSQVTPGGTPTGLLLALTTPGTYTYQLSVFSDGAPRRTTLA